MNKHKFFFVVALSAWFLAPATGFGQDEVNIEKGHYLVLEGEVLDIEGLDEPERELILTVRGLLTDQVLRLSADPHRTTVQMGGRVESVRALLSGSMATMIYRESTGRELPELVFIKVASAPES